MRTILGIGVLASLAWAAAIPTTRIQGNYSEARTADVALCLLLSIRT